jgi:dihydroxyacetone kinase-like protein
MAERTHVTYEDVVRWIERYAAVLHQERDYLTELDSAIGDADHGINMDRGFQAVLTKVTQSPPGDLAALLRAVGMTVVGTVGGAGGPLYGTFFLQFAAATAGKDRLGLDDLLAALDAGLAGVVRLGKAEAGDKTMVDALLPARDALRQAIGDGASFSDALDRMVAAAEAGMRATIPLVARKGRASYLGERSAGHQDPGATSSYLLLRSARDAWGSTDP